MTPAIWLTTEILDDSSNSRQQQFLTTAATPDGSKPALTTFLPLEIAGPQLQPGNTLGRPDRERICQMASA
ncbi:hypothetical protein V490_09194 [Pseudogymnoascus sp. VKM F-3557]|nr:hypothetical protein V490_09194 [Pseudogymnoascus sp. VKM F-3557]